MPTPRQRRFVRWQGAWILGSVAVLGAAGALSVDVAFAAALLGFFVVTQLTAPVAVRPAWRSRLRWVAVVGVVVFAALTVQRAVEVAQTIIHALT